MTTFPDDFLWGAATSSYQIEGAHREDGRSECIWDRYARTSGRIDDGTDGSVACDHYHRWRDDVANMKWLGLDAYRFSVSWARILPEGRGTPNQAGIDWYARLIDHLLESGIEPMLTLYHWDMPQVLEDTGGWPERDIVDAFVEYADVMSRAVGDRVTNWVTHNEPWCIGWLGYALGTQAPGRERPADAIRAFHHLLLSHGRAVPVIRGNSPGARVGIVNMHMPCYPASQSRWDREAARLVDGRFNRWFLDPLFGRGYPKDVIEAYAKQGHLDPTMPFVQDGDLETIATPTDFYGMNMYSRSVSRSEAVPESENLPVEIVADGPRTDMGWEVYPDGLYDMLMRLREDYPIESLYITENGAAYPQGPLEDGTIPDHDRVEYFRTHLAAAQRAIEHGVPLKGYFAWSLMDNYEWAFGFTKRFGLFWVDYATMDRSPKDSAHYYRGVIARGGLEQGA